MPARYSLVASKAAWELYKLLPIAIELRAVFSPTALVTYTILKMPELALPHPPVVLLTTSLRSA